MVKAVYTGYRISFYIFLILVLFGNSAKASHIIGGDLSYTCLGNDEFQIELTFYRDCFYGDPRAVFDEPAVIGVFDVNNVLVDTFRMELLSNDTLPPILQDSCLFLPGEQCVHVGKYQRIVHLPFLEGGYTVAYQRCCRNAPILNIIEPTRQGMTFVVSISEQTFQQCNNGAKFNNQPPIFLCVNEPFKWDHSAYDLDGDSLSYRFSTPISGGTFANPKPDIPPSPPYLPVVWNAPLYGIDKIMGEGSLSIDPLTGEVSGTPQITGLFVVSITVDEFKDGLLINQVSRDFQYNVGVCQSINFDLGTDFTFCDNLTIDFVNNTENADRYLWLFNDPGNPGATSMEHSPKYTFSDVGTYDVMLVATRDKICIDTFVQEIFLQNNSIQIDFEVDVQNCVDSSTVVIKDLSIDSISGIESWYWELEAPGLTMTSTKKDPRFRIDNPLEFDLSLQLVSLNGCVKDGNATQRSETYDPTEYLSDTFNVCKNVPFELNADIPPNLLYNWTPAALFPESSEINPVIIVDSTTNITVSIYDSIEYCNASKKILIDPTDLFEGLNLGDLTVCHGSRIVLNDSLFSDRSITWLDQNFILSDLDTFSFIASRDMDVTVTVQHLALDCELKKTIKINVLDAVENAINEVVEGMLICNPGSVQILSSADPNLEYKWEPESIFESSDDPFSKVYIDESREVTLTITDPLTLCTAEKSIALELDIDLQNNLPNIPDSLFICSNVASQLANPLSDEFIYEWSQNEGIDSSDPANPIWNLIESTTFNVQVLNPGSKCNFVKKLHVEVAKDPTLVSNSFPDSLVICKNQSFTLNLQGDEDFDISWQPHSLINNINQLNISLTPDESTSVTINVVDKLNGKCDAQKTIKIIVPQEPQLIIQDTFDTCGNEELELKLQTSTDLDITWSTLDKGLVNSGASFKLIPDQSRDYFIFARDQFGCLSTATTYVNFQGIKSELIGDKVIACDEFSQISISNESNESGLTYNWEPKDYILSGTDSPNPILFNDTENDIQFTVQIKNEFGCIKEDNILLENPFGTGLFKDQIICLSDVVSLNPDYNSSWEYLWNDSLGLVENINDPNPQLLLASDQSFLVTVTNQDGCERSGEVNVEVINLDTLISVDVSNDTIYQGTQIQLMITDNELWSYQWSPADKLSDPTIYNPTIVPESTTIFSVEITDLNGCIVNRDIEVFVRGDLCAEPFIFFPNAFTPNGDGRNDVLRVRGNVIAEATFIIYNRWGQEIFTSHNLDEGWDGTYKGKQLTTDVFSFYLKAICINGEIFEKQGNVTLIN